MADEERLVVLFEARLKDFEQRMQRSVSTTRNTRRQIERESDQLAKKLEADMSKAGDGFGAVFSKIRGALGIAGLGLSAGAISNLTSEWSDLNSRVVNAVGSMSRGEEVMGRLSEMARRTYSSIGQTTESFIQNSDALTDLGYNFTQQLDLTEALNNALVISATRGQQADAVMRAWSNAMALGELRGQNLNTIIQGSSRLTRALADSMGVSTNELRKMGNEGRITSQDMFNVTNQLEQLRAEADAMPATLQDSFVLLGNAVMQFVGQADQASGATGALAGDIISLADSIERMAENLRDGDTPLMRLIDNLAAISREIGLLSTETDETVATVAELEHQLLSILSTAMGFSDPSIMPIALTEALVELSGQMEDNEITAQELQAALVELGGTAPNFAVKRELDIVIDQLREARAETNALANALRAGGLTPRGPTGAGAGRSGIGQSRRRAAANTAYIAEQERLAGLTREQLTLEQAIARERQQAAAAGVKISEGEIERLARLRIAQSEANGRTGGGRGGRGGASPSERFEEDMRQVAKRMPYLRFEAALTSTINQSLEVAL